MLCESTNWRIKKKGPVRKENNPGERRHLWGTFVEMKTPEECLSDFKASVTTDIDGFHWNMKKNMELRQTYRCINIRI